VVHHSKGEESWKLHLIYRRLLLLAAAAAVSGLMITLFFMANANIKVIKHNIP
jgi:hypothetical protein